MAMPARARVRGPVTAIVMAACAAACAGRPPGAHVVPPRPDLEQRILAEIRAIRVVDVHSHATGAGGAREAWSGVAPPTPFVYPFRLRYQNRQWIGAWRELWGYAHDDMSVAHLADLHARKLGLQRQHGDGWPTWVLDRVGIETMILVEEPQTGQAPPRFRSVPFFPGGVRFGTPDAKRKKLSTELGVGLPATMAAYEHDVIAA